MSDRNALMSKLTNQTLNLASNLHLSDYEVMGL
jgi:hypothetical protein